MRAQRCAAYLFSFLFLLTNLTNGEGTTPPRLFLTRFDAFRRERGGFNPLPPCFRRVSTQPERVQPPVVFDALASAQRRNEEGLSLLVTSIWPTRRGRGWVQPSPFGFDVFQRVRGVFNPSSSSRREWERVQPLIIRFRPGWTRTRRGLIPPHLFSTRFDANGDGVNPFPFFFDVFRRERGGHQPSLFAFDVPGCFNTSWHFVFCFL